MANLDQRFFCTSDLDSLYRDNSSGEPLSGGIITFYSDVNRTALKPVYQLTGSPGNYSYSPLPNPCVLSSAGTFQDGLGNNIVPYYYPFTSTPAANTGVQELYYITVQNSGFVPQFVRQGWPQAAGGNAPPVSDAEIDNFIPNGQFLSHNNTPTITQPPITQLAFGAQTVDAQPIAQGGWYFAYTDGTSAQFSNSFSQIPSSGGWGIDSFPKYLFNFSCTSIGGGSPATRDLWITWPDINKFSSGNPPGSTTYTLFFDSKSNDSNSYTFTLYQIYYFGTGGSPSASFFSEPIATIEIGGSTLSSQNIQNITWLVNQGTIGANGDDFVGLALRGPASAFNVSFSDFSLVQGNQEFTSFPVQTNDQMLSRGVAGFMPTPDPSGQDLYLPLILTHKGMIFDHSQVGQIITSLYTPNYQDLTIAPVGYLPMLGGYYSFSGYSNVGVPYNRLGNYLVSICPVTSTTPIYPAGSTPVMGTGINFAIVAGITAQPTNFQLNMNTSGGADPTASGALTFTGSNPNYIFTVNTVPALSGGACYYWSFTGYDGSISLVYNVCYTVNGAGTFPATPTGANITVALVTGDTTATTVLKTQKAINLYQFGLLNFTGVFLRNLDHNGTYDLDYMSRTLSVLGLTGAIEGSFEASAYLNHGHTLSSAGSVESTTAAGVSGRTYGQTTATSTGNVLASVATMAGASPWGLGGATDFSTSGGTETRPVNIAVQYYIKY